jgi:Domain of unknown function (DUF4331)
MSHHYSGPNIGFPRGDARLDLTDLYAFPKPGDPSKSIFIINVHPSVGLNPPGPTTAEPFAPEARYELMIDTDGDTIADIGYEVRFSTSQGGGQTATLRRFEFAQAVLTDADIKVIVEGVPVSMGREGRVTQAGDHSFFAGWRSDPFFFDVLGTIDKFHFKSGDFFADKDICSIALEVPNSLLGADGVGVWARTLIPANGTDGGWLQADRGARPNQTPFLSGEHNDAYLAGEPVDDEQFIPVFAHALEQTGGYAPEEAKRVAAKLLPDILIYNPKHPASFPNNGRALLDDVSDVFLAILTNGKVTGDNVGPHNDFLVEFPYLGPPHMIRSR